jgi:protein-S-isoprenylcysteine O-methyltransferase Ste14
MSVLELKIPPPVVTLLTGAGMWAIARSTVSLDGSATWRGAAAALVALTGGWIAASGAREFRRAHTTVNPMQPHAATALVTTGIFSSTRNPMYVGMVLVLLGWLVWLSAPWAALGPVVFVAYIGRFQIAPEERALQALFGDAYAAYCQRVRRWV